MSDALKNFLKTTEAIGVFAGLFLAFIYGKLWIIATAIFYLLINVPGLIGWIRSKLNV